MVLENIRNKIKRSYRNLKTEVLIDKDPRSRGQTKDFRRERRLNRLYSNNSSLKIELV